MVHLKKSIRQKWMLPADNGRSARKITDVIVTVFKDVASY